MTPAPTITIFVRHAADCKYKDDETWKRCDCRKHFRWVQNGKQYRRKAGTRSWTEAERIKRGLEDQFSGRVPEASAGHSLAEAIEAFHADKKTQGLVESVLNRYRCELARLQSFAEGRGVHNVSGITLELLIAFRATWDPLYPSSTTRSQVQKRVRGFLRFCYDLKWLDRVPRMSPITVDEPPTMPLTAEEFARLLETIPKTCAEPWASRLRVLMLLMRWSGLALGDALDLRRDEILFDKAKDMHRIVTARQKTGTDISVPLPPDVARELLALLNGNPLYVFWSGIGKLKSCLTNWGKEIKKLFNAAGLQSEGRMTSHRLRDTFAVDLLQKGVPLEEVSKLLGHTSIVTTEQHYAKWVKGRQDRLDSLVVGTWTK